MSWQFSVFGKSGLSHDFGATCNESHVRAGVWWPNKLASARRCDAVTLRVSPSVWVFVVMPQSVNSISGVHGCIVPICTAISMSIALCLPLCSYCDVDMKTSPCVELRGVAYSLIRCRIACVRNMACLPVACGGRCEGETSGCRPSLVMLLFRSVLVSIISIIVQVR